MTKLSDPFFIIEYRPLFGVVEYVTESGELTFLSMRAMRFGLRAEAQAIIDIHDLSTNFGVTERRHRSVNRRKNTV